MAAVEDPAREPRFSIISAVYDVGRYLDEFIASIERQTYSLDDVEVIMVDDGSTDDSARILAEWQRRRPGLVRVLTQANAGQGAARNTALDHVRGEWVTMPDPDDVLADDYLDEVDRFIRANPDTAMVATNRIILFEATGLQGKHPLHTHFMASNRLRNLDEHPLFFHGSAPASFFRRDVIAARDLRFDDRIRPQFEDGHFCSDYLLGLEKPFVGFVRSAEYLYRKRADQSSTLNTSRLNPGRYTTVLELGYLSLLEQARRDRGYVPAWLQNFILYELSWYFQDEESAAKLATALQGEVADRFNELLARIAERLDERLVQTFGLRNFKPEWREILLFGCRGRQWHATYAVVDRVDMRQKLVRVVYRYTGRRPSERFLVDGWEQTPLHGKDRGLRYFERTDVMQRIAWLPYGTVSVELDGVPLEMRTPDTPQPRHALEGWRPRNVLVPQYMDEEDEKNRREERRTLAERLVVRAAASKPVRRLFGGAWVLMDRTTDADDSGEHVFRYLRQHRRKINAWFVLERQSPDYRRLRRDGFRRVVPYGGLVWKLLMLNADQVISSHADVPIMRPPEITRLGRPRWRSAFLQHGVTKDDLSNWLNPKRFDVFVASTPAEYESLTADGTAYEYTSREVVLTGLPRFDALREIGLATPPDRRDLLLVAPTWRQWLTQRVREGGMGSASWSTDLEEFAASDYAQNWSAVLRSPRLAEYAERHGLTIALLMHPNQQAFTSALDLPPEVERLDFESDVRQYFARSRVTVTDYSSMAFNAAYIDRPVVYFQFDRDLVMAGGHLGRRGYFDYEEHGFGPVTLTPDDAIAAVIAAAEHGPAPEPHYQRRIDEAFPERDGRCRERVVDAILRSVRPVTADATAPDATRAQPSPDARNLNTEQPPSREGRTTVG